MALRESRHHGVVGVDHAGDPLEGADYVPTDCTTETQMFVDVPPANPFCPWIEELARRNVVSGCGDNAYCPGAPVTRAQMAVFVSKAFGFTLYGP